MVGTLMIRKVSERTKAALSWGSAHYGKQEGSKVAASMLNDFPALFSKSKEQEQRIAQLERALSLIHAHHERLEQAKEDFLRNIALTKDI